MNKHNNGLGLVLLAAPKFVLGLVYITKETIQGNMSKEKAEISYRANLVKQRYYR